MQVRGFSWCTMTPTTAALMTLPTACQHRDTSVLFSLCRTVFLPVPSPYLVVGSLHVVMCKWLSWCTMTPTTATLMTLPHCLSA